MIDITKKYKTKTGLDVVLVSDKGRGEYPIIGFVEFVGYDEDVQTWTKNGVFHLGNNFNHLDLVEVKEKKVAYLNIEKIGLCGYKVLGYGSRQTADFESKENRIARIRIEYEEGQFDE